MKSIDLNTKTLEDYKMKFFNEVIKLIWQDKIEDINDLPKKILGEDMYKKFDEPTIINLFRVTMGLNTVEKCRDSLSQIVYESLNLKETQQPIISIISDACNSCRSNNEKNKTCLVKEKHINCNEKGICSSCGECISKCNLGAISDKIQFVPMINLLKDENCPVYAIVAPAYVGQFGKEIVPGKLRTGLKQVGFEDMIEVALAADLLTAKEAFEYCEHMKDSSDEYFITSCCCPVWVSLIQNNFPEILDKVSPSVSPMVACGRAIKILNPNAKVVFIGPCTAKKKEATLDDIKDAIDFVLTFKELEEIFNALEIDLSKQENEERVEAAFTGRVYATTGGVSEAVKVTAQRIDKDIKFVGTAFNGIKECKEGIQKIIDKEIQATFIEGMGCVGGCVGGPRRILRVDEGTKCVKEYCKETSIETPFDNLNVAQFLSAMGIKKIENLGKKEEEQVLKIFSRDIKNTK